MNTYSKEHRQINIAVGDRFSIELDTNPTTGYEWQLDFDNNKLKFENRELAINAAIGGGGIEHFNFEAIETGKTSILMRYQREWEPDPLESIEYCVYIKDTD